MAASDNKQAWTGQLQKEGSGSYFKEYRNQKVRFLVPVCVKAALFDHQTVTKDEYYRVKDKKGWAVV